MTKLTRRKDDCADFVDGMDDEICSAEHIPTEIGQLTALTELELGHGQLTGACARGQQCATWWSTRTLTLYGCAFDVSYAGRIPTEIGKLTSVTSIELSCNELTGACHFDLQTESASCDLFHVGPCVAARMHSE